MEPLGVFIGYLPRMEIRFQGKSEKVEAVLQLISKIKTDTKAAPKANSGSVASV